MADQETVLINRPPRIQPDLPQEDIDIPEPPDTDKGGQTLVQMFLPLLTIIGYVIVSASGQGRNIAMLIPMGLSVVASSGLGLWTYLKEQREDKEKKEAYRQRLGEMRREMENYHDLQRNFYAYNYPSPELVLAVAQNRESDKKDDRFGTRLWERRTSDPDFGTVRLGMGTQPSSVLYALKMGKNNEDPLMYEAIKLADDSKFVQNIPVVVKLRPYKKNAKDDAPDPGRHSIGITGKDSARVYDFTRAMLTNFAAFHAPTDTRLFIFGAPSDENNWNWARYLPHCNTGSGSKPGDQLCFSSRTNEIENFWDVMIKGDLERRLIRIADDANAEVSLPFLVIVVDALSVEAPNAPTKNIDAQEAISLVFRRGQELGATIIFLMPDTKYVPTQVETVIEVDAVPDSTSTLFRYTEIGVNTRRVIGIADTLSAEVASERFSLKLRGLSVRSTFGTAGLPSNVLLLNLHEHINGDRVDSSVNAIWEMWGKSRNKEEASWLRVPVGFMPGPKKRDLVFSANGDGVHGMIAGTTGSGKSEMLITLILGLAVRYDPSVINFVLVDFKGGTAFKMFERLPHVVNLVTSLQGNAGERTFIALEFEMKRRAKMLADSGVPHIVDYRSAGYHRADQLPAGSKVRPAPFPFLFVIIDEFAEMVKEMPQFRPKLDSVTRLGRAYGVSLILATQRPAGAVTDQMRANIKFKICLRVETAEDSRELLRASDAAFLPTGVPGRAYLMIGNDNSQLMQVAYASYRYNAPSAKPEDEKPAVIKWLERPKKKEKKAAATASDQLTIADRVVQLCAQLSLDKPDVIKQDKPWPDPLPVLLPLNAEYINSSMKRMPKTTDAFADAPQDDEEESVEDVIEYNPLLPINKALDVWLKGGDRWQPVDWESPTTLAAKMGLIDDPYHARQLPLNIDLKSGSVLLFGASGKGKTGFLRTMATTLATIHSPDALWMYALDFGGGGLTPLLDLPHMGAIIGSEEGERVERLINTLKEWQRARGEKFSGDTLTVYNKAHPNDAQPAVLVMIDNFAEFRASYEDLIPDLMALIREGLSKGIYFAVTADQLATIPGRLMSLFNQRLTLKIAEPGDYVGIVGRVPADLDDIPGRGYINIEKTVLECQIALPVSVEVPNDEGGLRDISGQIAYLSGLLKAAWAGKLPKTVLRLESIIPLEGIVALASERRIEVMLGKERRDLTYLTLNLKEQGPHFPILGSPFSGRTTTLRTFILSIAAKYSPERAAFILIDAQRRLFQYGEKEERTLTRLPHVRLAISEQNREQMDVMMESLKQTYANRGADLPEIFIFIDNYDDFSDLMDRKVLPEFATMARRYGAEGLHVVIASGASSSDELFKVVTRSKYGLALDAESGGKAPFNIAAMNKIGKLELPIGRSFLISTGRFQTLQVSTPYPIVDANEIEDLQELMERAAVQLDGWVERIEAQWASVTPWKFPSVSVEAKAASGASGASASNGGSSKPNSSGASPVAITPEFLAHLRAELKKVMPLPDVVDAMTTRELLSACIDFSPMVDMAASALAVGADPKAIADALVQMGEKPEKAQKVMGVVTA